MAILTPGLRRIRRWISLLCCGTVAATVVALFDPFLRRLFAPTADRLSKLQPTHMIVMLAVIVATGCWFAGRNRWRGFIGLRFFFTYPPLWVAMVVGFGELLWARGQMTVVILLGLLLLVPLGPGIAAILHALWHPRRRCEETQRGRAEGDFEELLAWLPHDSEIDKPASDRFGHDVIAQRMADRLTQNADDQTMALIGPVGSGKSTIRALVDYHLQDTPRVRLVHVSLWPFDSTEAAVRGILRAIIDELARHVNVLPLVGLTDDYVAAIEKTAGGFGGIARLLRGTQDPEKILKRFSAIACAAGLRIVLWIEDLERFSGGDQLEGRYRDEREVERLGPIRALLYLLDRCRGVSVVVSDTSLRTRFDIGKIARFVEQPPPMDTAAV